MYLPIEYNENNILIDDIDRHNIGFKIEVNENIEIYEFEQDEFNIEILKEDKVMVTKQNIDGINFIDIEKIESDLDEK